MLDLQNNRSEGVLLSEVDLGGNVGAFAMVSEHRGYVVVADDASFVNSVRGLTWLRDRCRHRCRGLRAGLHRRLGH